MFYETRWKAKKVKQKQPANRYRKSAKYHLSTITTRQTGSQTETEDVSTIVARVLLIAE